MWSLQASLDLPGIALLRSRKSSAKHLDNALGPLVAAGRYSASDTSRVPPDVIVEGPDHLPASNGDVTESWSTIRTIVVPHGIAPCRGVRRSRRGNARRGIRRPRCKASSSAEAAASGSPTGSSSNQSRPTCRPPAAPRRWCMSLLVILVLLLLAARAARADLTPRKLMDVSLRMPDAGVAAAGRRRTAARAEVR